MKKFKILAFLISLLCLGGCNNDEEEETIYRIETFKGGQFQLSLSEFKYGLPYLSDKNKEGLKLTYTLHSSFEQIKELEYYAGSYKVVFDDDSTRGGLDYLGLLPKSIAPDETVTIEMKLSAFKDWSSFVVAYKSRDINYKFIMNRIDYPQN